jgi:hypothetical protein
VFRAGVGGGRGSYLLVFRSDLDAAGSSRSGRTWTLLALSVPVGERRVKGSGMAGVPSQREGTGREKGESVKAGVPSQWEGTGQEEKGESGKAGVPSQWEGTGQEERRKRESRGSLAMGGNGPGRKEKAGCRLGRSRCWS